MSRTRTRLSAELSATLTDAIVLHAQGRASLTVRELAEAAGLAVSPAHGRIRRLIRAGLLAAEPGVSRSIRVAPAVVLHRGRLYEAVAVP